jgi:hypothetical protein
MQFQMDVNRKLALIVAAIVLPGGFVVLLGVVLLKALKRTARGRKMCELAQRRVSTLQALRNSVFGHRQAA